MGYSIRSFRSRLAVLAGAAAVLANAAWGRWCLWPFAADVPPSGIEIARFAAEFARDRAALTGASVSLSQGAVNGER